LIIFLLYLVILSGERIAFFLSCLYIFFLIIILPKSFFNKLIYTFLLIATLVFIFNYNNDFSQRLLHLTKKNIKSFVLTKDNSRKNILSLSEMHDDHYSTGMEMFKDNFLFGQGLKMFRIKCNDEKFKVGTFSCSTHPHNIIIQFLAELGVIGILFLLYFYLSLFLNIKVIKNNSLITSTSFLVFLIFFPLLPYGNFFHNGLVIMNILSISILWCLYYDHNKKY